MAKEKLWNKYNSVQIYNSWMQWEWLDLLWQSFVVNMIIFNKYRRSFPCFLCVCLCFSAFLYLFLFCLCELVCVLEGAPWHSTTFLSTLLPHPEGWKTSNGSEKKSSAWIYRVWEVFGKKSWIMTRWGKKDESLSWIVRLCLTASLQPTKPGCAFQTQTQSHGHMQKNKHKI